MGYAVIKTGGKQYKVSKGDVLEVDKLEDKNKEILLSDILLIVDEQNVKIGKPKLPNAKVKAEVLDNLRGEKIRVAKFKAKARYRKTSGFRASLTRLKIQDIVSGATSNGKTAKRKAKSQ